MAHNKEMQAAIDSYKAKQAKDTRTREQLRADNRRARMLASMIERGGREAGRQAGRARRAI